MKEIARRTLEQMPCDKAFWDGESEELCHATGDEVLFEGDSTWWCEFEGADGSLHYGN